MSKFLYKGINFFDTYIIDRKMSFFIIIDRKYIRERKKLYIYIDRNNYMDNEHYLKINLIWLKNII